MAKQGTQEGALALRQKERDIPQEIALQQDQSRSLYEHLEALYCEKLQLELELQQSRGAEDDVQDLKRQLSILKQALSERDAVLRAMSTMAQELEQQVRRLEASRAYRLALWLRKVRNVLLGKV